MCISDWPTFDAATGTFADTGATGAGSGVYQLVADKIDTSMSDLKLLVEGADFTAGSYATLKDIQAALVVLEGSASDTGSVLFDIAAQISSSLGTFPSFVSSTGKFHYNIDKTRCRRSNKRRGCNSVFFFKG